jgi:uncharacterized repeat protein (TIGR01451 family)
VERKEEREMKPRWLLLAVSVICLLVLAPASALSDDGAQMGCGAAVQAGCGAPDALDAVLSPGEWDDATEVEMTPLSYNWIDWFFEASAFEELRSDVSISDDVWVPATGSLWLMNDYDNLYVAALVRLWDDGTEVPFDDEWFSAMCVKFSDEPDALDDLWASMDCDPWPGEGSMCVLVWGDEEEITGDFAWFMPWSELSETPPVAEVCDIEPLVGVDGAVGLGSVIWEWAIDLGDSELDKAGPGDCFRFATWLAASGGPDEGDWYRGQVVYPASLPNPWDAEDLGAWPDGFGTLCLNPCIEVTKSVHPEVVAVGEEVEFTITVTNIGLETVNDVVVKDKLDANLSVVDVQTTKGTVTIDGQVVRVNIGTMAPGETVTITITAQVLGDGEIENVAVLQSAVLGAEVESNVVVMQAEADFVPEPQALLLFGSGLAGLAGYATLRWRTRK